jgi:hypothetical protein
MKKSALVFAVPVAVAMVAACSHFDSASPVDAGVEASADASPVVVDAGTAVDAHADADAALPCLSNQFDDAGGCDPVVFVTPEIYRGDLGVDGGGGLAAGDAICAALGAPYTFKAWLSDNVQPSAGIRFTEIGPAAHRPVYLVDGTLFVDSYFDLVATHGARHPLNLTIKGGLVADNDEVWTGTDISGSAISDCAHWTSGLGNQPGAAGRVGSADSQWTVVDPGRNCDQQKHIYCFQIP